jgi:ribulose-phosphate 3-epimerase
MHLQDFASAGANMYTFHLEAVVPEATTAKHPDPQMVKVLKEVKEAGMHAGIALKPKTPAETLFPYIEDGLVDQVHTEHVCALKIKLGFCLLAVEAHT